MIHTITNAARSYFIDGDMRFVFERAEKPQLQEIIRSNLYIHIPFCKNLCPYCPYNKIEYDENLVGPYLKAMLNEISLYRNFFGSFEITSIYIGGGSPVLLVDELEVILQELHKKFKITGDICIEMSPNDICRTALKKLKMNNVRLVSIGVQSFLDKHLDFIGRKYRASILDETIGNVLEIGFGSINLDLMFALPGQNIDDLSYDLERAAASGANQITTYPLFTFPYSTIGRYLRLKKVRMPRLSVRRKLYHHIHDSLIDKGFNRVSVWGFKKGTVPRYSSVTRDHYIGLGAGAGSHMPDGFYLNTFSVEDYIEKCISRKFPTALFMKFNKSMQNYFWFYWRLYDTIISKKGLYERFGKNDRKIHQLLGFFKHLDMIEEKEYHFELNKRGAFWIHLLQNYFSLNYINRIWTKAMHTAYPERICL